VKSIEIPQFIFKTKTAIMKLSKSNFSHPSVVINLTFLCLFVLLVGSCTSSTSTEQAEPGGLKDYYADNYLIGVALFPELFDDTVTAKLVKTHFNSITAENDMKWERVHPTLSEYTFDRADRIVDFTQANDIELIGHTLVWHSQLGKGVLNPVGEENEEILVDSATLMNRIKEHIFNVAGRYKGKVHGWDVVNEALNDDGTLRESGFLKIAGDGYIAKAFEFASEADPEAELYYNDYNLVEPAKREGAIRIVKSLQEKGLRIDAVGVQAHWELDYPTLEEIEKSILAYADAGVQVMFTELDISVLPSPWRMPSAEVSIRFENNETMNPYPDHLPDSLTLALARRYKDIFAIFNKHSEKISRVTFWGLHDGISWKNGFPIRGRTDYPLLFDRKMKPKEAYWAVVGLVDNRADK
jgi:endo-1,4-beta-xylanase